SRRSYLGWTFGFLWTLGWVSVILLATSLFRDISEDGVNETEISLTRPVSEKMILAVSEPQLEYTGRFGWMNDGGEGWNLSSDTLKLSMIKFTVLSSKDSAYHVKLKKHSFGRTPEEARQRAEQIQYAVYSKDSV